MLHSDTPFIVEIILEGFRIREQSTVSNPKFFCRFSLRGNTTFDRKFWFGQYISA